MDRDFPNYLNSLFDEDALRIADAFERDGHAVRVVGGCVRDAALGALRKDIDLATTATPDEMIAVCNKNNLPYVATGLQHGTITITLGRFGYEITTLRIDRDTDGRHATVEFTTDWYQDAARRDFTINAMSVDREGRLFDYFDGMEDIRNRRVRFVGKAEDRIREDYLRILRYFRFRGRIHDVYADDDTLRAIAGNANGLLNISGERIWMEMSKIFSGDMLAILFRDMTASGICKYIGLPPETFLIYGVIARGLSENEITVLAGILPDIFHVESVIRRWKLSGDEQRLLRWLVQMKSENLRPKLFREEAVNPKIGKAYAMELAAMVGDAIMYEELRTWAVPVFPVRGEDLLKLGMKQGRAMGDALAKGNRFWIDSDYTAGREEILNYITSNTQ